jgi:hypothetical protein
MWNEPWRHLSRRQMLQRSTLGFGAVALAGLLDDDDALATEHSVADHLATAKRVVFIFLGGGPGQNDTFDPKPELTRLHGQNVPDSIAQHVPQIARAPLHNLLASPWKFRRAGQSGLEISELFPHVASCADDLCVIRSCRHDSPIHAPAEYLSMTGSLLGDRPSLGAWLTYGLGSENQNLPGFIVFKTGETVRPPTTAAGFLPARHQGIFVDSEQGISHLQRPPQISEQQRRAELDFLQRLNARHLAEFSDRSELEARIASYELAPESFDISHETAETEELYGLHTAETKEYARIFLTTRRLIERGVRFIQIRSGGWDAHSDLLGNHSKQSLEEVPGDGSAHRWISAGSQTPRPARRNAGHLGWRVRSHTDGPARFRQAGSRSFSLRLLHVAGRRRRARRPRHRSDRSCGLCGRGAAGVTP